MYLTEHPRAQTSQRRKKACLHPSPASLLMIQTPGGRKLAVAHPAVAQNVPPKRSIPAPVAPALVSAPKIPVRIGRRAAEQPNGGRRNGEYCSPK
jgi:hypothetical protein